MYKKPVRSYSKTIIAIAVVANIVFTLVILYLSYLGMHVPDSLIVAWFSFWSIEVWQLAQIKKTEVIEGEGELC